MRLRCFSILSSVAFLTLWSGEAGQAATRGRFAGEAILKDAGARISAGVGFACQVKEDGKVRCWGFNSIGQLGNDSTTNSPNPVLVSGIANAVAVSAGLEHACALLADGTVRCWGHNTDGRLGDGTTLTRLTPVAVSGLSGAVAIAAGGFHTCALLSSGFVRCWGFNGFGELGNGNEVDQHVPAATQLSNAIGIAAGLTHTCALLADGTASCWGDDFDGQLGIGSDGGFGSKVRTPVAVKNVTGAVAISADVAHTCVLLAFGTAKCWGENEDGESGTGGTSHMHSTPVAVVGLSNAVTIDAGSRSVCASLADGTARCWGANDFGQTGDGTVGGVRPSPVAVRGLSIAVAITAGSFSCALLAEGSASCWGANDFGQLGGGTAAASSAFPVTVTGGGGSITARAIAAGRDHTCALRANSTVACWGSNDSGQIGDGTIGVNRLSPTAVPGLSGVIALAAGDAHTCALLVAGTVRCWGLNSTAQLGNGSTTSSPTPIAVSSLNSVIAIAAGGGLGSSHTCALRANGEVFCWGANGSGQAGNGTTATLIPSPNRVNTLSLGTSVPAAVSVAAGAFHTCALLADGTATCWGFNSSGQVGDGSSFATHVSPVFVTMKDAVALAAGDFHTCALVAVGAQFCWGANGNGQLGSNGGASNKPFPVLISLDQDAVGGAAGFGHTCALVSSGGARCWGDNSSGQLGIASITSTSIPQVVKRLVGNILVVTQPLANAVTIAAGRRHTCAVVASGFLFCWGDNTSGQLGFGSTTTMYTQPNAVPSFALNIDPTVTFKHQNNDRQTTVTVIAICEAGLDLFVDVTLTQGQASGRRSDQVKCTGGLERYPVKVNAQGRDAFEEGAAQVSAEGLIEDGGLVVDVQDWTRAVNIVDTP